GCAPTWPFIPGSWPPPAPRLAGKYAAPCAAGRATRISQICARRLRWPGFPRTNRKAGESSGPILKLSSANNQGESAMAHILALPGSETSLGRTYFQSVLSYKRTLAAVMGALLLLASAPPVVHAQNRLTLLQQQQRQQLLLVQQQLLQAQQQQLLRQLFSNNSTAAQQMQWLNQPANQKQIQQYLQASAAQRRQFFQQQLKQATVAKKQLILKKKLKEGPIRVLFIGDSLTMANNLPYVVAGMAAAVKMPALTLDSVLIGGTTLQMFWNQGTALRKIRQGKFDYVVLQEQSMMPIIAPGEVLRYARLFDRQ